MLDIQFIRDNPEKVKKACKDKGLVDVVGQLLVVDNRRRLLMKKTEEIRAQHNQIVRKFKDKKFKATDGQFPKKFQEDYKKAFAYKQKLKTLEPELKNVEKIFNQLMLQIPNMPSDDAPLGKDESENCLVKKCGEIPKFDFEPRDHLELGERLDLIDVKRAAKISGTRFGYLKNEAVLLEFALIKFAFDLLTKEGFTPIIPPALTKVSVFHGLGYSEHGGNEDYYLVYDPKKKDPKEEANYYLIGTAEHSIVPMYMNEILLEKDLPKRLVGFSSSFRREAGSYGKDTRGIFRVHQFDKVEMVSFTKPQESAKEHQYLLLTEEKLVQVLGLPYRVVKMCTGDLGFPAASKYDLECWIPSQEKYRETHSTSNCTDFQARRLNIKYRRKDNDVLPAPSDGAVRPSFVAGYLAPVEGRSIHRQQNKTDYVHILNGTAFAIGRMIIAILENYQTKEGWVKVPKVLQKYVGKEIIKPSSFPSF